MENYILRKIGAIEKEDDTEEEEGTRSKTIITCFLTQRNDKPYLEKLNPPDVVCW